MRYAITDEIWAVMGPMVDRCKSRLGPEPLLPDRMFFEAVLHWARTGVPWRDLPDSFGDWSAVYNRLRRWIDSGRMKKLFEAMAAQPDCEGTLRVARSAVFRAAGSAPSPSPGRSPNSSARCSATSAASPTSAAATPTPASSARTT